MKNQPLPFLGGLTAEQFLQEYWQKKPLFVKGAFPNFEDPLTADEIAGLAFEPFIPSRFIYESGGERPWQLKMGPATEEDFSALHEKSWMLVVNDVEKNLPELKSMLDPFRFISHWRLDDLQVSLGEDAGNVGAHWDDYDVFLLQGMGKKRWQISYAPVSEDDFVEGVDIRLIENFRPDEEWIVEPGDLLYLPPRIGHYGVNIGRSVTWSIGFRAPKHREMLRDYMEMKFDEVAEDARYSDPQLEAVTQPGALSEAAVDRIVAILESALTQDRTEIAKWFGAFITEPKMFQVPEALEECLTFDELVEYLDDGGYLEVHPGITLLHYESEEEILLFAAGKSYSLPLSEKVFVEQLTVKTEWDYEELTKVLASPLMQQFLLQLIKDGILLFDEGKDFSEQDDHLVEDDLAEDDIN